MYDPFTLKERLYFGKYEGSTLKEIYCGPQKIPQKFLKDFLNFKLKDIEFSISGSSKDLNFKIKDFEILTNNEVSFDLVLTNNTSVNIFDSPSLYKSALDWINWNLVILMFFEGTDYHSEKQFVFENPTELIGKINELNNTSYFFPSANPEYINWCIKNLNIFFMIPDVLISLQNKKCYHFCGVSLYKVGGCIYKYEKLIHTTTFKFDDEAVKINNKKYYDNKIL